MPLHLLLVDDEAINLLGLKAILRRDYEVTTAISAREALAILARQRVDAVISDQKMPGMLGTELFAACQDRQKTGIRIILSGYDNDQAINQALASQIIDYSLGKPIRTAKLLAILHGRDQR